MNRADEPPKTGPLSGPHRRHSGGSRRPASDRVTLVKDGRQHTGWALNISRGGMRIVLEDPLEAQSNYELLVGDDRVVARPVRVVWIKEQADGQIAGLQFLDAEGTVPPAELP